MTSKSMTTVTKRSAPSSKPMPKPLPKPMPPPSATKSGKQRWAPHAYQKRAVKFLLEHGSAALFLDPGLGKTSVTIAACKVLMKEGTMRGALVVAPLRPAQTTWPKEIDKWDDFKDMDLVVLHGAKFDKLVREKHDIYVINYEGLGKLFSRRKVGKVWRYEMTDAGKALMGNVDTLVWDELSKMKNAGTLRYTLIKPWLKKFLRRWGLTGSPASNGLLDLFGQCYVLDEGRSLGPFVTHYRHNYFLPTDTMGYNWRPKEGAEEAIYERLRPLALRMDADDYLTLPKQFDHAIKFDLPPAVRKQYDELENELLTLVEDEVVSAANMASANSKCRQVCSGAIYMHDIDPITGAPRQRKSDRTWAILHDEKLDALEGLIDELQGQQLLVAYDFNHDLDRLLKRFPKTPFIGGGVSTARGAELEAAWNRGELPLLFGHPASIGHGLNLQESNAHHIAWFTLTWDFELYDQFNRRLRRQGNSADYLHVYQFMARDSVEESVAYALRRKFKTQKLLLDALKTKSRV